MRDKDGLGLQCKSSPGSIPQTEKLELLSPKHNSQPKLAIIELPSSTPPKLHCTKGNYMREALNCPGLNTDQSGLPHLYGRYHQLKNSSIMLTQ